MYSRRQFFKLTTTAIGATSLLALTSCGGSSSSSSSAVITDSNSTQEYKSIDLGDAVLYDDDNVTITVKKIYEEYTNWADGGPAVEKAATFGIKNKSDKDITFYLNDCYIGEESAWVCGNGGNQHVTAGKNGQYSVMVGYVDGSKHKALENLEDIYSFNGKIEVSQDQSDGLSKDIVDYSFSFESIKK